MKSSIKLLIAFILCTFINAAAEFDIISVRFNPESRVLSQNTENTEENTVGGRGGPCLILAVANVLILRNIITLPNVPKVSAQWIKNQIGEFINQEITNTETSVGSGFMTTEAGNAIVLSLTQTLSVIDELFTGLNINPDFTSGARFAPPNSFLDRLGALGIPLVHAWVLDPDLDIASSVKLHGMDTEALSTAIHPSQEIFDDTRLAAYTFFEFSTDLQVTKYGLAELDDLIGPDFGILFMGNHFNVVGRFGLENRAAYLDTFGVHTECEWRYVYKKIQPRI